MENIIILPTDKPSRLFYNVGGALLFTSFSNYNGVNIYIVNDDEIKAKDWYIAFGNTGTFILQCEKVGNGFLISTITKNLEKGSYPFDTCNCKKIILTTDKMLVDDGVEQLTDDFLTWFTQHQNCTDYSEFKNK